MIAAALLSILIGLALGLLGGGGSILALPVLVYVAGVPASDAVGMSLAVVGATSAVASVAWARRGEVDLGRAALFGGAGLPAAFVGARLTARVPAPILLGSFALVLVGVGLWMAFGRPPAHEQRRPWPWVVGAGAGVGILTGFLGVGGGFLIVPALVGLAGLELRKAIGTSLAVITLNSAAGWLGHVGQGDLRLGATAIFTGAAIFGALVGQRLAARLDARALRRGFAGLVVVVGALVGVRVALSAHAPQAAGPAPVPLATVFGDKPWIKVVPQLAPVDGVGGVRAQDCAKCHRAHYDEWARSTHAHAYTDLQFQSELGKPTSPKWLCLNCHIPVENQRDVVVRALAGGALDQPVATPNPGFDPTFRDEGISCATCHVRKDAQGKSYILGSIGGTTPPHPVKIDRAALLGRCEDCHNQSHTLTPKLVCAFQTGTEVRSGPEPERACASCHLPALSEARPLTVLGTPPRTAHRHDFVGGPVPKEPALRDATLAARFVPALDVVWDATRPAPDRVAVTVKLTNAHAAHKAPTGDPERFYQVEAQLLDAAGATLATTQWRIGQRWEWEPAARRVEDNRIAPGETRVLDGALAAPPGSKPARVRLRLTHVRLTADNAAYMKKTAAQADPRFAPRIAALDEHYPMAATVYEGELILATGRRSETPRATLLTRP